VLWVANTSDFGLGQVDALRPYSLVRTIYGEPLDVVYGYQFGLAFLWTPLYGAGKVLAAAGVETIGREPAATGAIALATSLAVLAIGAVLVPVLNGLRLPHPGLALVAALFGSPLFFYATFQPGQSHVVDTLALTAMLSLLFRYLHTEPRSFRLAGAIGVIGGLATTVRLFSSLEVAVLALGLLAYGHRRAGVLVGAGAAAVFAALAPIPSLLGADSFVSGFSVERPTTTLHESTGLLEAHPANPLRMLFSDFSGLFPWAPLTLIAIGGYAVLVRGRPNERPFLLLTAGACAAVLVPYAGLAFWDGESRFANRYLTPLYPLVVLGLAALFELRTRLAIAVSAICCAWSVALSFNALVGIPEQTGASELPRRLIDGRITPAEWIDAVYHRSRLVKLVLPDPVDHG